MSNYREISFKQFWTRFKPYIRWLVIIGLVFFLFKALQEHRQEVTQIQISPTGWATLAIATGITLLAHTWAGWVWTWMLYELDQPVPRAKFVQVYLKTNIAKYLPGNIWHYYGRITTAKTAGVALGAATLSVLLEPLLMLAAALVIVMIATQLVAVNSSAMLKGLPLLGLAIVLTAVHPRFLNWAIQFLGLLKAKATGNTAKANTIKLQRYPVLPLLGEIGFLVLRTIGFILVLNAIAPLQINQFPLIVGAFNLSWLLGLIVPIPGGLGIFDTAAAILLAQSFSPAIVISAIALYRAVNTIAEAGGAGLAWLDERF